MERHNQLSFKIRNAGRFFMFCVKLSLVFSILFIANCSEEKTPPIEKKSVKDIDPQKLAGRWLRPDGGYVLELSNIGADGRLDAAYFNPKPINVAISAWQLGSSHIEVYVEFDDVNYKGSTYKLDYFPEKNRLIGIYYQSTLQQEFYVEFSRME